MGSSKKIQEGDEGYDAIHRTWVYEGRPSQFDRQGAWGGALYNVLNRREESPDFYQRYSEGPTIVNDETEEPEVLQEGWHTINRRGLGVSVEIEGEDIKVRHVSGPNSL